MAEKESHQPTHTAFSVIKREGKEDYWLDIGVAFPHKDGRGFTVRLQAGLLISPLHLAVVAPTHEAQRKIGIMETRTCARARSSGAIA